MATMTTKQFSDKRLVKYLMEKKGVETVIIEKKKNRIVAIVDKKFKPAEAENMSKEVGRTEFQPFHTEPDGKKPAVNGIIYPFL
jgi:hypothetical protein